ncbi:MAG: penicillin-binding transpeptidase domain-containing protein, partial [Armatimonadota bacterium]
ILGDKPYERGKTLKLHIDRDLQIAAQRAFGDRVGALVAIDPRNGAVLCMTSNPTFDPNVFAKRVKISDWNAIAQNKKKPLLNRSLDSFYPPGSTFKPLVAAAALKYGVANEKTSVHCTGSYYFGRTFRDWSVHGNTDFYRAISHSCNVWFYAVGRKLGIDRIAHVGSQFGIGKATNIDLPEERLRKDGTAGIMPSTEWKKKRYGKDWIASETLSCAIGQGYVEASAMQMAIATAAIANKGRVYKPHILSEVQDVDGKILKKIEPELVTKVDVEEKHLELVRKGMRKTVESGTGAGAYRGFDIPVSGKTGTAQNPHGVGHGWFICFAPYDNPTIAIACIVEQGVHGSTSAAPITRALMDVYFGKKKPHEIEQKSIKAHGD